MRGTKVKRLRREFRERYGHSPMKYNQVAPINGRIIQVKKDQFRAWKREDREAT